MRRLAAPAGLASMLAVPALAQTTTTVITQEAAPTAVVAAPAAA